MAIIERPSSTPAVAGTGSAAPAVVTPSEAYGVFKRPVSSTGWRSWLFTVDHKKLGIMYGVAAMVFFIIGGLEALLIRAQLAGPEGTVLSADQYNQMFTMHATTMVFLFVMPMAAAFANYFVPLQMRVTKARALKADLFVSVHADAWLYATARGSSVYALSLSGATSAAARWLARRENEADLIGGVNLNVADPVLKQTLLDLSQTATINDSLRLGRSVLGELGRINRLHRKQVEQAGFAVLKAPDIPSILVETAFISNPDEERRLTDEAEQERLARAILDGIRRYIAQQPALARPR